MYGTVVAVLRGGPSNEHEVSLKSGHAVISTLPEESYTVRDIFIDTQGVWHYRGLPVEPHAALRSVDVALVMLHGAYGEDGEVQKTLERFGVPFVGSDSFASFVSAHKVLAKEKAREHGIKTPRYRLIEVGGDVDTQIMDAVRSLFQPVIVKPVRAGSSRGVSIAGGYAAVQEAVHALLAEGNEAVLIEERIRGTEATVGIIEGMRGERLYALPPIEIRPPEHIGFFSYEAKYDGISEEICPGRFKKEVTKELMDLARTMHDALGMRHYSRSDFIVAKDGIYLLETNNAAAVGMTKESLFPKSLAAVGIKFEDFLKHVIDLALKRN